MPILINSRLIQSFIFPAGEVSVNVKEALFYAGEFNNTCYVDAYLYNSDDIMKLCLSIDAIRKLRPSIEIELIIPYFPYARQDRVCNSGEALSVKVMANIINSLNCDRVIIYDPHSNVTPTLINNCIVRSCYDLITYKFASFLAQNDFTILIPDSGAEKRVIEIVNSLNDQGLNLSILRAVKERDKRDGKIINIEIFGKAPMDTNIMIIDDICDGGSTFIELSKALYHPNYYKKPYLYVTHGIFSKGLDVLRPHFNRIFCYHTFLSSDKIDPEFLEIIGNE